MKVLKIYMSNTDKFKNEPLCEVIVYAAKRYGMTGATAVKGFMGFGQGSIVSNLRFWEVTEKTPVVIEIVDTDEKICKFVNVITPYFDKIKHGCLLTAEDITVLYQRKAMD